MAQGIYIGVYQEGGGGEVSIASDSLLEKYFAVTKTMFAYKSSESPQGWYSINTGHSTTGSLELVARQDYSSVTFYYGVNSEASYDKLTVKVKGTAIATISGTSTAAAGKSWTGSLSAGDTIQLTYSKDDTTSGGKDCGWLYDLSIKIPVVQEGEYARPITDLAIGVEGVARRILYGYIVAEGVIRPCYTVKPATWAKYNCTTKESSIYIEDDEPSSGTWNRTGLTAWSIPRTCTFSSARGYYFVGPYDNYVPGDGLSGSDLQDTWINTAGGQSAIYIVSATVEDDGVGINVSANTLVYRAEKITATVYAQGTTSYGTVISDTGGLPNEGTLVEGSIKDGYCVCDVNGTKYYYVLQ